MTKQLSLSATISALTMTLFALSVAVTKLHDERGHDAANAAHLSVSAKSH
ncbi:hypothetical protein [Pontixanthobacter sp.]